MDEGRRRYVKTYYRRRWDDPANYHLVLNTGAFSYGQVAELICEAATIRLTVGSKKYEARNEE